MGMFDRIKEVKRQYSNNYLRGGGYLLRLDELRTGDGRKGEHWRFSATVVAVIDDDEGRGHRVGEVVKRICPQKNDSALPEFKSLVCTLDDCDEEKVDKEFSLLVCGDTQPCAGMVVEVHCTNVITKAGKPFTQVDYRRCIQDNEVETAIGSEAYAQFFPQGARVA